MLANAQNTVHYVFMQTRLNQKYTQAFTARFGTKKDAVEAIRSALGCSLSKAQKIRLGSYPSELVLLERIELAKLFRCKEEELFMSVETLREHTTSKTAS